MHTAKRLLTATVAFFAAACVAFNAQAQLNIEITSGVSDPIPIAVVPFARAVPADGGIDVGQIIQRDLEGSGRFRAMARGSMSSTPTRADDLVPAEWRAAGNDYAVVGRVTSLDVGQLAIDFELVNLLNGQRLAAQRFQGTQAALRNAAHRVSDVIYEKILGVRGAFATRIAYVSVNGKPPSQQFRLVVADADGENHRVILESRFPIMSPAWSPDGEWLAYVSFESKRSAVFVQRVRSGERRQVSARAGINGAPAWSPDGQKLAITLGGSTGNADIYVLDLSSQQLTRVTDDAAIDTEPAWSTDGKSLYFTSDRAGGPQIYRVGVGNGERAKRITFGSSYNARPRVSQDGTQLAMVTLDGSNYRIAVQDLSSSTVRVLSKGRLDEAPSFAPNGAMLIYSGSERGQGVLQTVSVDGLVGQRLKSEQGDVREPVWGPFLR